jgi:hypothetical protein
MSIAPIVWFDFGVTFPRATGPVGNFENHLEEGYDKEDTEAGHGGIQSCGGGPAG